MRTLTIRALSLGVLLLHAGVGAQDISQQGALIFKARCAVCHGMQADGRSDLARLMRPPPANLRASQLNDEERARIVRKGGEAVGRSSNMPVWEQELNEDEIRAVLAYVGTVKGVQP